jgi:hypothetical protein
LAAIGHRAIVNADDSVITENVIVCWSYPSSEILFQEKLNDENMNQIEWNPFRLNVFATFHVESVIFFKFLLCLFRVDDQLFG